MREYVFTTDDIVEIYKRYVMRSPSKTIHRHTGKIDEIPKKDWEIKNDAMVWYSHFKNRG